MSWYITDFKEATAFVNIADFPGLLQAIKKEISNQEWKCYGWHDSVEKANTLEEVSNIFGIELKNVYDDYFRPVFIDTYASNFFSNLINVAAPYMTNGKIFVTDGFRLIIIKYKNGKAEVKYEQL